MLRNVLTATSNPEAQSMSASGQAVLQSD